MFTLQGIFVRVAPCITWLSSGSYGATSASAGVGMGEEVGTEPSSSAAQTFSFQVYTSLWEGSFLYPAHPGVSLPLQMFILFSLEHFSYFPSSLIKTPLLPRSPFQMLFLPCNFS